ncbi:MAG: transcription termination/antitermination protein NusA [Immundisolibacter sp.]|uniref:transcription termination factor NusA n=1 Tax=Immundisolibacter sp. TaxID=1934948 RepID=UPI0019A8DCD9|nr:transcription termination factor NusA [Immundisolibacter sp.]MBC7161351.1 transcription termination/antitermination protein NusA [Immundisolibacter sp.]
MDTKEILQVVDVVSNEKGVSKEVIFEAIEAALAAATRKVGGEHMDVRVAIDRHSGSYETFRRWTVVDDAADEFDPEQQIRLTDAKRDHPGVSVGDVIEEPLPAVPFGRIASQMAKQVIVQKVRDAEREKIVETYAPRIGHMLVGQVKRLDRGNLIVDLGGNVDALLTRDEMIARENIRIGDRVCALLADARIEQRGPQLFLTRRAPKLMMELFRREVPEVADGIVEVVACARDPGVRAKIAVRSYDPRIDPIGACVGMHGTRVQAVSNELAGERVDIVLFDANPAQFVLNALSPAKVVSITMDEESHTMDVAVAEDQLSIAIGRGGQNVRLASELTGWELNLMTEEQAAEKQEAEIGVLRQMFVDKLDLDQSVADILVQEGFTSVEEVAFVPAAELLAIEEFDEDLVQELRSRAQNVLLTQEISREEQFGDVEPAADLLEVPGMSRRLAYQLAAHGIVNREDLADQAVPDLLDIEGFDEALAGQLIMAARSAWFTDGAQA